MPTTSGDCRRLRIMDMTASEYVRECIGEHIDEDFADLAAQLQRETDCNSLPSRLHRTKYATARPALSPG